jgi:hypothetical protein
MTPGVTQSGAERVRVADGAAGALIPRGNPAQLACGKVSVGALRGVVAT